MADMSEASQDQLDLSDAVDKELLDVIKNGAKIVTKGGKVVTVTASAGYFQAAISRLSKLGITKLVTGDDPLSDLADKVFAEGMEDKIHVMPPISEEQDDDRAAG